MLLNNRFTNFHFLRWGSAVWTNLHTTLYGALVNPLFHISFRFIFSCGRDLSPKSACYAAPLSTGRILNLQSESPGPTLPLVQLAPFRCHLASSPKQNHEADAVPWRASLLKPMTSSLAYHGPCLLLHFCRRGLTLPDTSARSALVEILH